MNNKIDILKSDFKKYLNKKIKIKRQKFKDTVSDLRKEMNEDIKDYTRDSKESQRIAIEELEKLDEEFLYDDDEYTEPEYTVDYDEVLE